ncbi:MAG: hypothetical protein L6R38_009168 [Xanthoria sp. 2 TBL-2021]|nr:MAG: hypothetical protein L6R38_009168 [Xanthoria sp. 2 TBL-2021]
MVSATSTATDPAEVWRQLNRNHIYKDNEKGEKLGAVLITQAKEIINNKRQSVMEDKELGDYKVFWNEYATAGETTFLINLCEVLLKKDRKKRNDLTDKDWVITAWKKDGLRVNWQEHFATEWVPQLDSHGDEWLAFLYENVPKVKTPWPDITYGYTRSSCDYIIDEAAHHFGAILVKEVLFPWLFDEAKGAGQPFAAASYQAARAGAAANHQLVEVFRRIHEEIAEYKKSHKQATSGSDTLSKKSYPYVDEDPLGMVFCLAVCPDVAELSVHFAEHHDDKSTYYHMHIIGAYAMKKGDDVRELRKHINNILDWGLTTRKEGLEKKFADFFEQVGLGKKRKGEEHSGGDEKAKSAKPGTG